jgi:AcrR family transcriptional regulator/predicted DNA-binding transcriptional regulator AlpA
MDTETRLLKISELERLSGVPRHTIHRYIHGGLLHKPIRTGKTMAYYDVSHLERLKAIREIKGTSRLPVSYLKKTLADREATDKKKVRKDETRKSGQPETYMRDKRKQQIKDAAFEVFLEKGFQHTKIQDITTAAGISTGTFYLYYMDKRALFMDMVDEVIRNTLMTVEDAVKKESDILIRAKAVFRFYMENYGYFSGIINQLRGMMAEDEPLPREKFITLHSQLANSIMREVRAAINNGLIRDIDPELLTESIMGIVEFLSLRLSFDDKYTIRRVISFMIDLLMHGISKS